MNFIKSPRAAALDTLSDVDAVLAFLCTTLTRQDPKYPLELHDREQTGLYVILESCQHSLQQAVEILESASSITP